MFQKKHRHRPVAMTPLLMPFAQPADGFGSHPDPSSTIYHFLSPRIGTVLTKTSTLVVPAAASEESPSAAPACRLITVERTKLDAQERTPPHWYSKREKIECLLQIAESLDWTTEASTTLTSSSTGDTDSGSPCTSHSAQSAFQDVDPLASPLHTISTSSTSSAYGPYFDTAQYAAAVAATARTYSPDARELLWADEASFSAGPADISPTPRAVGLSGAGYPGNEESSHNFGETWPQKSQQQLQINTCTQQRRASTFQPDFTMVRTAEFSTCYQRLVVVFEFTFFVTRLVRLLHRGDG